MDTTARVLAHSRPRGGGPELVTVLVTLPRFLLPELGTHRRFSRSTASSRARPTAMAIMEVRTSPFVPPMFGAKRRGMQAGPALVGWRALAATAVWRAAAMAAVVCAWALDKLGVHKQWAARLLEPFMWSEVLITSAEWRNFLALRDHPDAQPEMQTVARTIRAALDLSTARELAPGEWHDPFPAMPGMVLPVQGAGDALWGVPASQWASVGRCARLSYQTHEGRWSPQQDFDLAMRCLAARHMGPMEHVAVVDWSADRDDFGNLARPWVQVRKHIEGEAGC